MPGSEPDSDASTLNLLDAGPSDKTTGPPPPPPRRTRSGRAAPTIHDPNSSAGAAEERKQSPTRSRCRSPRTKMLSPELIEGLKAAAREGAADAVKENEEKWERRISRIENIQNEQNEKFDRRLTTLENNAEALEGKIMKAVESRIASANAGSIAGGSTAASEGGPRTPFTPNSVIIKDFMLNYDTGEGRITNTEKCSWLTKTYALLGPHQKLIDMETTAKGSQVKYKFIEVRRRKGISRMELETLAEHMNVIIAKDKQDTKALALSGKFPRVVVQSSPAARMRNRKVGRSTSYLEKECNFNGEDLKVEWGYERFSVYDNADIVDPRELMSWSKASGWSVTGIERIREKSGRRELCSDYLVRYIDRP